MKVIIAGGRDFNNYELLREKCDIILSNQKELVIVSGRASGADSLGERYAKEKGYEMELFPADWKKYGKSAGYVRNSEMAEVAESLIAFWDGKSRGTKNMIDIAKNKGLKVRIVNYESDSCGK
jgi:hypothetical protein